MCQTEKPSVRWLSKRGCAASLSVVLSLAACATAREPAAEVRPREMAATEPEAPAEVIAIPNARSAEPGIVTGGIPSEANLQAAKEAGYRTVVSLLPEAESRAEAATVAALGLDFVAIPITGEDDLTEDNARKLGDVLSSPSSKPLILHCASGNRAGALLALHAFYVEGKSAEQALALGEAAGLTKLRDAVQAKLAAAAPRP
jgi:protein tyrosine phosphatase (PTP) superfamily phosphohydrolase (DUF442 family)